MHKRGAGGENPLRIRSGNRWLKAGVLKLKVNRKEAKTVKITVKNLGILRQAEFESETLQ